MAQNNRRGVDYPEGFMKVMKKKKHKKIRNTPVDQDIFEKKLNDAERLL